MATIKPFRATRAQSDLVEKVVSDSFQNYTRDEIITVLKTNPYSFLNILCPKNVDYSNDDPSEKFKRIHDTFKRFNERQIFLKDDKPNFYLYQINNLNGESIKGFIAAASTEDYRNGIIKKHENTIYTREVLFKDYLKTVKFNAEPVLMTYKSVPVLEQITNHYSCSTPEYHFFDKNKREHKLWLINSGSDILKVSNAFQTIEHLYIADGHHRTASSSLLALEKQTIEHQSFMVYLIPESTLKIKAFNRFIKDLNSLNPNEIISSIEKNYIVKPIRFDQINNELYQDEFIMYIAESYYHLKLKPDFTPSNILSALNTQLLYDTILKPILGINDLRNNKRIEYIEDKVNQSNLAKFCLDNKFQIGFKMAAISITTLKEIADLNLVMPPKSTFIEPKLKSGLIIYNL